MIDPVFIAKALCVRQAKAAEILLTPTLFKVCEGCGGIAKIDQGVCPVCKAYRFDTSFNRLHAACAELGDKPFPSYPATAPRLPKLIVDEPAPGLQIIAP